MAQEDYKVKITEIALTSLNSTACQVLSGHTLASLDLMIIPDIVGNLVFQLKAQVLAEQLEDRKRTVTFFYPKSWWQRLKQEYFPEWLMEIFPLVFVEWKRTVFFERYATYPEFPKVADPKTYGGKIVYKAIIREEGELSPPLDD